MLDSILNTIKQMLGIPITDISFDQEVIVNINSVFMVLHQLGIGPSLIPFEIQDNTETWTDFLSTEVAYYSAVKTYIYLKVKLVFDPAGTSFLLDAIQKEIVELEWRLTNQIPIPPDPAPEP
jgi:hypothetical protein